MTVISTHRFHTYKATATIQKRSVSPKKIRMNSKHNSKVTSNYQPNTKNVVDVCKEINKLYSYVYDVISNKEIYEIEVMNGTNDTNDTNDTIDEDLYEEMWAYYDRLEDVYDV